MTIGGLAMIADWQRGRHGFAASLGEELRRAARSAPDRPFLRMIDGDWSFGAIDRESDILAAALAAAGVRQGAVVSLMLPNSPEFVIAWMALAKLGAVTAPLNTAFRGDALRDALQLAGSALLIAHAELRAAWGALRADLPALRAIVVVGGPAAGADETDWPTLRAAGARLPPPPSPEIGFADLCLLLYTSGSTGRSKAAMIPHRFVLGHAALTIEGLGLRPDDVLYCPYPLFHLDAAVMTLAPALLLRGVAAIGARFSVSRFWDEIRAFEATVFDFMGATLTMLWKAPPSPRDREHRARLGWGVPLPDWADGFEARFGCRLVELYGSTEAGTFIFTPLDAPRRRGACGRVRGPFETRLADPDGHAVPVGAVGELLVRTSAPAMLTQGYFGMPDATRAAFRDLWFHTGDLLRQDADGYFHFVGRGRDVLRRRGENISAAEVEACLEAHPDVLACAVFGVPSEWTEEEVMACVQARPGSALDGKALVAWCAGRMARFMVPRYVRFVDGFARTPTDKIEKFRLREAGVTPETWDREAGERPA
jgi:crotonobetaine/carnitine-CoA ligase